MTTAKPTEAQRYYLTWLANGGEVQSDKPNARTKRAMLEQGWVTDDGDDLHLTAAGRAAINKEGYIMTTMTATQTAFRLFLDADIDHLTPVAPIDYTDEAAAFAAAREWVAGTDNRNPGARVEHVTNSHRTLEASRRHGERWGQWYSWQKCRVTDVSTVAEFLSRYYKRDRYTGQGEEYAACLLKSHTESFERNGFDIISHHDSNTGEVVAFYGKEVTP